MNVYTAGLGKNDCVKQRLLVLDDVALVGDVETVQEFSDILVAYKAGDVHVRCTLRDHLDVVALEPVLVLLSLGFGDCDSLEHWHLACELDNEM